MRITEDGIIELPYGDGANERILCPEGTFEAVCSGVHSLGLQRGYKGKAPVHKFAVLFEIEERILGGNLNGQRYHLSRIVSASFHHKSNFMEIINAMSDSNPIQAGEGKGRFNPQSLVGRSCLVCVAHETSVDGETHAHIVRVKKHPEGTSAVNLLSKKLEPPYWVKRLQEKALPENRPPAHNELQPDADKATAATTEPAKEPELVTTTTTTALVFDPGADVQGETGPDDPLFDV